MTQAPRLSFRALAASVCLCAAACAPAPAPELPPAAGAAAEGPSQPTASVRAPTPTFRLTPTSQSTPTAAPQGRVTVSLLDGFDEPAYDAEFVYRFEDGDPLYVIGRDRDCTWLQVQAGAGEVAWVNTQLDRVRLMVACDEIAHATVRPDSGTVVVDQRPTPGYGEMFIDNGLPSDACVLLVSTGGHPMHGIYLRAGDSAGLQGVPNGDFWVYYSTGAGWDSVDGGFTIDAAYRRFEEPIHFESSRVSPATWRLTLHAVPGGTASVQTIEPEAFPAIGE